MIMKYTQGLHIPCRIHSPSILLILNSVCVCVCDSRCFEYNACREVFCALRCFSRPHGLCAADDCVRGTAVSRRSPTRCQSLWNSLLCDCKETTSFQTQRGLPPPSNAEILCPSTAPPHLQDSSGMTYYTKKTLSAYGSNVDGTYWTFKLKLKSLHKNKHCLTLPYMSMYTIVYKVDMLCFAPLCRSFCSSSCSAPPSSFCSMWRWAWIRSWPCHQ